jgi:predicted SprT family Zn-dependent metalloprotease
MLEDADEGGGMVSAGDGVDAVLTARAGEWLRLVGAGEVAARLVVVWNGRLQTTAGTACARTGRIELNPRLAAFGLEQVERTLRHEAAHLLAHWRSGRRRIQVHGEEWRRACAELGIAGEKACHSLPLPRRQVERRYCYRCPQCHYEALRVRPFGRYTACYRCCRAHSGGRYDARFQFVLVSGPVRRAE